MIDDRLVSYVEYYLGKGYSEFEIAGHLIKQGYFFKNVWETINLVKKNSKIAHNIH